MMHSLDTFRVSDTAILRLNHRSFDMNIQYVTEIELKSWESISYENRDALNLLIAKSQLEKGAA